MRLSSWAVLICCLFLFSSLAYGMGVEEVWSRVWQAEQGPARFEQTLITVFPGYSSATRDLVTRFSPRIWEIKRWNDSYEQLVFTSTLEDFQAWSLREKIGLRKSGSQLIQNILGPGFIPDSNGLTLKSSQISRGRTVYVLERPAFDHGLIRYWVEGGSYRLFKEEGIDGEGRIIYSTLRSYQDWDPDSTVLESLVPREIEIWYDDEPAWWQALLTRRALMDNPHLLLPQMLPNNMYLVTVGRDPEGVWVLRYSDGKRVISLFQTDKEMTIKEGFVARRPLLVYATKLNGITVTLVGRLSHDEVNLIMGSLESHYEEDQQL